MDVEPVIPAEEPGPTVEFARRERSIRLERSAAWLRTAVVAATTGVYTASIDVRRPWQPLAASILAIAAIYSLWVLLARPYRRIPPSRFAAATLVLDTGLVTLWCYATGGPESEFWGLYVVSAISVAVRYDPLETAGTAFGQGALYAVVMTVEGGLRWPSIVLRPALMLTAGVIVSILSRSERVAEFGRVLAERQAHESTEALTRERRVVERLRELDRAKTDFVATAAHELRSPLAGIRGVLETVRRLGDDLEPEVKAELLEGAGTQAARLSRLIDDLLTVSRIEDGSFDLAFSEIELADLVDEAARATDTSAMVSVETEGSTILRCDGDQIVRVLINLLDNARKYSPEDAPIQVLLARRNGSVRIAVRDHGPGVRPEDRETIFDRYRRLGKDGSSSNRVVGTGLGLWIVRNLVEAHAGTIAVGDAPDGGAEFVVTIPNHPAVLGPDDVADVEAPEDDEDVREFTADARKVG